MRRIELTTYEQQSQSIEYILKKYKVPYTFEVVIAEEVKLIKFVAVVPNDISRDILDELGEILDTRQKEIYLVSYTLDSTVSTYLEKLDEEIKPKKEGKTTEEFHAITEPSVEFRKDLLALIVIASGAALVGLFTDNGALIIGAMLLAPLLGPITAFSFNVAVGRPKKIGQAAMSGFILLVASFATGAIVTIIFQSFFDLQLTDEILLRTEVSPLFIALAIALGIAGGIAISSNIPGLLVGIAIAAALVPPTVVTGIGAGIQDWEIFSKAFLLTAANVIGLVLGTIIVFFVKGISPRQFYEKEQAKRYLSITIGIFVVLSVLLGIISI